MLDPAAPRARAARGTFLSWPAIALFLCVASCADPTTVTVPHPLTHASLSPSRNARADSSRAEYFGLPFNTFTSEASIAELDAERACFQLVLRVDGQRIPLATPSNWRVYLRASPSLPERRPAFGPPAPQTIETLPGSVPREVFAGYTNSCVPAGRFVSCSPSPRYTIVRDPMPISVVTGAGAVCFANDGAITAATRVITLHLDDPGDVAHRMAFRWQLLP